VATTNLAFVNRVLELTNQFRSQNNLGALQLNVELNATAQAHSTDMAQQDYFSHTGKNGSQPWDRAKLVGYEARSMGENIAAGYTTPEAVVQGWINSPGHRANLLNSSFTELGVGYYLLSPDTGSVNYGTYWTQVFGSGDTNPTSNLPNSDPNPPAAPSGQDIIGTSAADQLIGSNGNDRIFGNGGNDRISGGKGDDLLNGGIGGDTLTGGEGRDTFLFDSGRSFRSSDFGVDRMTDFIRGTDQITLDKSSFGNLSTAQIGSVARDTLASGSNSLVVYSRSSGRLFYNPNGNLSGYGRGGAFAIIDSDGNSTTSPPALTSSDFQIVA
jgi:Ca2+-binding RTX toxin-like protein